MPSQRHAEVVGGGFAGLVAAAALAQRGWSVRLHERARELRAFGAGIFVWENGLRVLQGIGACEEAMASSHQAPEYQVRDASNRVIGSEVFGPAIGTRMVTMTRQALHAAVLNAAVRAGVSIRPDSRVVAAEARGAIRTEDGATFAADLVVGADGVHSAVRDSLGLLRVRHGERYGAIRLLMPREPGDGDEVITYRSHGPRRTLYVPCDRENLYLCFTTAVDDGAGRALPFDSAEWTRDFPHLEPLYARIGTQGRWDPFETIEVHAWSRGSVALIGDAAHGMTPALGQGAGCAMMNGLSLAEYVAGAADVPAALAEWERTQRPLTQHTQALARGLTNGVVDVTNGSGTKWTDDALRTARHHPVGAGTAAIGSPTRAPA